MMKMQKLLRMLSLALMLGVAISSVSRADENDKDEDTVTGDVGKGKSSPDLGGKKVIYRKHTAVSFDDAVVEGTANNPEGVYVVTPPEKQFGSLLKLRPNFHRELMRDALLLK